ncbi:MAG: topoisomerase DNA-binding C4 zinc finger domain-containing protein [Clostridiales bacterium]|nr:topoisomerase DNA-binding C4 zinc finger domain-containing protein [Clostridiales bacterium]
MLADQPGRNRKTFVEDYVVFDLETTGLSSNYDQVVEISGVKVRNHEVVEEFSSLVNPGRHIPEVATDVNGITDDMVREAPEFRQVLQDFSAFAGELVLVGHNIHRFDLPFLYRDAQNYWGRTIGNDYVDTLQMAKICLPGRKGYGLGSLAQNYGISTVGAHRALADCHMTQKVYEKLRGELENRVREGCMRICPQCGSPMVVRQGPMGGFWGCLGFPFCRCTVNIPR